MVISLNQPHIFTINLSEIDIFVILSADSLCKSELHYDWRFTANQFILSPSPLSRVWSYTCVTADGQSASLPWNKAPIWGLRPGFYYCQLRVC
jgi:hypothetical protein